MFCPHCKARWQLPQESTLAQRTVCPFCEENLYENLRENYTVKSALQELVSRFGTDILVNSNDLTSAFEILAPNLDRELQGIRFFIKHGGLERLEALKGATDEEATHALNAQAEQMSNSIYDIISAFSSVMGIVPSKATAEPTVEWVYNDFEDGEIEIIGYKGRLPKRIIFPGNIDGKKVIGIGSMALGTTKLKGSSRVHVESIYVPEGVHRIGENAFWGCKALTDVKLPESLRSLGANAFKNCKALANVTLPNSLEFIGCSCFSGSAITSIVLPGGIGSVSPEMFANCKHLSQITLSYGINSIQSEAFTGCKAITRIIIPESVTSIEKSAFLDCRGLATVALPDGLNYIGESAFRGCSHLHTINIPHGLSEIGRSVFADCGFSSLVIPDNITQINDYAFADCDSMSRISIPNSVINIGNGILDWTNAHIICHKDSYAYTWAMSHPDEIVDLIEETE